MRASYRLGDPSAVGAVDLAVRDGDGERAGGGVDPAKVGVVDRAGRARLPRGQEPGAGADACDQAGAGLVCEPGGLFDAGAGAGKDRVPGLRPDNGATAGADKTGDAVACLGEDARARAVAVETGDAGARSE